MGSPLPPSLPLPEAHSGSQCHVPVMSTVIISAIIVASFPKDLPGAAPRLARTPLPSFHPSSGPVPSAAAALLAARSHHQRRHSRGNNKAQLAGKWTAREIPSRPPWTHSSGGRPRLPPGAGRIKCNESRVVEGRAKNVGDANITFLCQLSHLGVSRTWR